jgi:nicotinamidase-related amidase
MLETGMTSFPLDPKTTALIFIDLQHGIVGMPLAPYSGPQVVERASHLADAFRQSGATVVFVRVDFSQLLDPPADAPRVTSGPPPAIASELVPEAGSQPGDLLITKRQWGAFYGTELDQQLRRRGIRTIVLAGIATNFGVESTARAAYERGYEQVFVEDAMTSLSTEAHQFAIQNIFPRIGRVRTSEQLLETLSQ